MIHKKIHFKNSKGDELVGILSNPTPHTSTPIIIICHGFASNKDRDTYITIEKFLNSLNIATFRFDFYGHGESAGLVQDITPPEMIDDISQAVNLIQIKLYTSISLLGSSMSGLGAILTASNSSIFKSLILKSPVSRYPIGTAMRPKNFTKDWEAQGHTMIGKHRLNWEFMKEALEEQYNGFNYAQLISCPTLIIHGSNDELIPIEQTKKLNKLISNSHLKIIDGGDHKLKRQPDQEKFFRYLQEFVEENLL